MAETACVGAEGRQLVLFEVGRREVTVAFDGGQVVTDTGLLAVRQLDRRLGVLAEAAARLPDPRSELLRQFSTEDLLTQTVYQLLGGDFDCNDAQTLRHDPLMQVLLDQVPGQEEATLASGSTLARFRYAFTRRQRNVPVNERTIDQECQAAKCRRLRELNRYLVELFVKTRTTPPQRIVLDIDATDDPAHGQQQLTLFHGYYRQNQSLSRLVFDGESKFPLTGWLGIGTAHPSWGAVESLGELVTAWRAAWPEVEILIRADGGYASPSLYEWCEALKLQYVIGYSTNNTLVGQTEVTMNHARAKAALYDEPCQLFQDIRDYQAGSWDRPRRVIAKCEVTQQGGPNRRFVVTNLTDPAAHVCRQVYVKRGDAERAIEELKHGLAIDRLSSHRFFANAFAMPCHLLAYALFTLFREANADVPAVAQHTLETIRARVFKVGAVFQSTTRKIWFHASATWPGQAVFEQTSAAVNAFANRFGRLWDDRLIQGLTQRLGGPVTITLAAATPHQMTRAQHGSPSVVPPKVRAETAKIPANRPQNTPRPRSAPPQPARPPTPPTNLKLGAKTTRRCAIRANLGLPRWGVNPKQSKFKMHASGW